MREGGVRKGEREGRREKMDGGREGGEGKGEREGGRERGREREGREGGRQADRQIGREKEQAVRCLDNSAIFPVLHAKLQYVLPAVFFQKKFLLNHTGVFWHCGDRLKECLWVKLLILRFMPSLPKSCIRALGSHHLRSAIG